MRKFLLSLLVIQLLSINLFALSSKEQEEALTQHWSNHDESTAAKVVAWISGSLALGTLALSTWRAKGEGYCSNTGNGCGPWIVAAVPLALASALSLLWWWLAESGDADSYPTGSGNPYPGTKEIAFPEFWNTFYDTLRVCQGESCQEKPGESVGATTEAKFNSPGLNYLEYFDSENGDTSYRLYAPILNGAPKIDFDIEEDGPYYAPALITVKPNAIKRRPTSEIEQCSWLINGETRACQVKQANQNSQILIQNPGNHTVAYNITDNYGAHSVSGTKPIEVINGNPSVDIFCAFSSENLPLALVCQAEAQAKGHGINIASYEWRLNNTPIVNAEPNKLHIDYKQESIDGLTLTVTDKLGRQTVLEGTVELNPPYFRSVTWTEVR